MPTPSPTAIHSSSTFQAESLDHGLTLATLPNPEAHTAAVGFFVKTGTRDEAAPEMGVSHFLEHMMFKGTDRRTAADVNREFDELGANYNAYTSHETTVYYAQVLPEHLPAAVDLLGDMLRPALRTEDFEIEKKVILEEIGMYEDQPYIRVHNALLETYFGDHPLGFRVLGTEASIKALSADTMRDYFERRYSPDNIVVAAAGRFDPAALRDDLMKATGHWQSRPAARDYQLPTLQHVERTMEDETVTRAYIEAIASGPTAQDESRYAASILSDVIGDDEGSRLYWKLVEPGLADEADFTFYPQDRWGCFVTSATCDPSRAEQVERLLLETVDQCAATRDITAEEVQRSKNKIATQMVVRSEAPMGGMRSVGGQWVYRGEYHSLPEQLAKLDAVTVDDVLAVLEANPPQPRTIIRMLPAK